LYNYRRKLHVLLIELLSLCIEEVTDGTVDVINNKTPVALFEVEHLGYTGNDAIDNHALVGPIPQPVVVIFGNPRFEMLPVVELELCHLFTPVRLGD
jgi:hypothetical protein